jgi:hypothetical protein
MVNILIMALVLVNVKEDIADLDFNKIRQLVVADASVYVQLENGIIVNANAYDLFVDKLKHLSLFLAEKADNFSFLLIIKSLFILPIYLYFNETKII